MDDPIDLGNPPIPPVAQDLLNTAPAEYIYVEALEAVALIASVSILIFVSIKIYRRLRGVI